ncbi:MAG: hypothetical protein HRT74_09920 [Flavobacteriales bacterium]|nr:hypothetical protein [Flavobacteriales bacterium]
MDCYTEAVAERIIQEQLDILTPSALQPSVDHLQGFYFIWKDTSMVAGKDT